MALVVSVLAEISVHLQLYFRFVCIKSNEHCRKVALYDAGLDPRGLIEAMMWRKLGGRCVPGGVVGGRPRAVHRFKSKLALKRCVSLSCGQFLLSVITRGAVWNTPGPSLVVGAHQLEGFVALSVV